MTSASPTTSDESLEFSTSDPRAFLTGAEIREIEADPILTVREILEFRSDLTADPEPPTYECRRCHRQTVSPDRVCPDCAHELEGGR